MNIACGDIIFPYDGRILPEPTSEVIAKDHGGYCELISTKGYKGFVKSEIEIPDNWYVYFLIDSRDNTVVYVGCGKGNRMFQHTSIASGKWNINMNKKDCVIMSIGDNLRYILKSTHETKRDALDEESLWIKRFGIVNLINTVK